MSNPRSLRALQVQRLGQPATVVDLPESALSAGDTLVGISHSGINYKDALAVTGTGNVLRAAPMITGVDLAGTILETSEPSLAVGDAVFSTGHGLGEEHSGGHATLARLSAGWLMRVPMARSAAWCMSLGTAGLTAALAVDALVRQGITPGGKPIVVSGAAGGVGSICLMLLRAAGYNVTAVSGRPELGDQLRALGANEVLERSALLVDAEKPLARQRWGGGIDVVGGRILVGMLAGTQAHGCVVACGMTGGIQLPTTVMPFILRGVCLIGIESVRCPDDQRQRAWARLERVVGPEHRSGQILTISLDQVTRCAADMLAGSVVGRILVKI